MVVNCALYPGFLHYFIADELTEFVQKQTKFQLLKTEIKKFIQFEMNLFDCQMYIEQYIRKP